MNFLHELAHLGRTVAAAPVNLLIWLWNQPQRGRSFLWGMPAILAMVFVLVVSVWARTSLRNELSDTYVNRKDNAQQAIENLSAMVAAEDPPTTDAARGSAIVPSAEGDRGESANDAAALLKATALEQIQQHIRTRKRDVGDTPPRAAIVELTLLSDGQIDHSRIVESSGDPAWDNEVERGILATKHVRFDTKTPIPSELVLPFDRAKYLLEREQAALQVYLRKLIELNPNDALYKYQLALSFFRAGNAVQAFSLMRQIAPDDKPGLPEAHYWLAAQYARSPLFEREPERERDLRAVRHMELALRVDPNNFDCGLGLAQMMMKYGRYKEAIGHLERLFNTAGKRTSLKVTNLMVDAYRATNEPEVLNERLQEVEKRLRELWAAEPASDVYLFDLCRVYEMRGRFAEGVALLEENGTISTPETLQPFLADYYVRWGAFLAKQDKVDPAEVLDKYAKALEVRPRHEAALCELADLGSRDNPLREQALQMYDPVADGDQAPALALRQVANARIKENKLAEAQALLEKSYAKVPNDPVTANNLAYLLLGAEPPDAARALTLVTEAIRGIGPRQRVDRDLAASLLDTRASALMQLSRYQEAIADWQRALRLKPGTVKFLVHLRDAYLAAQLPEMAANVERSIERARSSGPAQPNQ